jgi:hypothetical protein
MHGMDESKTKDSVTGRSFAGRDGGTDAWSAQVLTKLENQTIRNEYPYMVCLILCKYL